MISFYDFLKEKYRSKDESLRITEQMKEKLNKEINVINSELLYAFDYILNTDPCYYWDDSVRKETLSELEKLYSNNAKDIVLNYEILEHFFIGYNSYIELSKIIQDLSPINHNDVIKNRMYRIPTYVSIVEGCLTNLLRVIILIINCTTNKDLASQKKLKPLCDALISNNFGKLVQDIDIDIRNAINHGGILFKEDGNTIEFRYTESRRIALKTLKTYELDRLIENVYDTAGGILLAICEFINNHIEIIAIDKYENTYVSLSLLCMELSIPSIVCKSINESIDTNQLNITIEVKNTDKIFILHSAIEIVVQVFNKYPNYEKYLLSFDNQRMLASWVRFDNKDIDAILNQEITFDEVLSSVFEKNEGILFNASTEDINLDDIKYHRYPNFVRDNYIIKNIKDASLENRKRLKAHIFIGDINDRLEIINIIKEAIDTLKKVKNIPSPKMKIKHGDFAAQSIYINVYRFNSRKNKELFIDNKNFVCFVDYNENSKTTLVNGGLPLQLWNKYYHERVKEIQIAWRTNQYLLNNIGRNDPCHCGSGRKYKKCCLM